MEGQLSEHPFAELISEILEKRFSGALRIERERVKAVVYFDAGSLIYATSNLRNLRLIEYLKKRGISTDALAGADSSSDFALAEALLAKGSVTKAVLDKIIAEQVIDVTRVPLLWISGQWNFDERARLTQPVRVAIQIEQLMLDAARRIDLAFAASRFAHSGELISCGINSTNELNLSATEGFLLSRVEEPMELSQLVSVSGLRDPDARRVIYGLVLTGLLQRQSWPFAFRTSDRQKPIPPRRPARAEAVQAPAPRDPREELTEFLEQLSRATNHYEVLNIPTSAGAAEAKHAYYALARRFHPDRFHELARTPLHSQLESAFARITQAHETLSDPDSKATYDTKIEALKRVGHVSSFGADAAQRSAEAEMSGAVNPQLAEQRFKEGVAALQLGETNTATSCFSAAARLAPDQARYRAYYGRALAAHPQTKRLAEAELQAAVKLDPANATYRVMLAALYSDLGFGRRAISELERALSLDANNAEARRMLESLEAKK